MSLRSILARRNQSHRTNHMKLFTLVLYKSPIAFNYSNLVQYDYITLTAEALGQDETFIAITDLYREQLNLPTFIRDTNYSVTRYRGGFAWTAIWNRHESRSPHLWVYCADSLQHLHEAIDKYGLQRYLRSPSLKFGQYWRDITNLLGDFS